MNQRIYTIQGGNIDCAIFNEYTHVGNGKYTRTYFRMMKNNKGEIEYCTGTASIEYTEEEFMGNVCDMTESEFHYMYHLIKMFGRMRTQLSDCITKLIETYGEDT